MIKATCENFVVTVVVSSKCLTPDNFPPPSLSSTLLPHPSSPSFSPPSPSFHLLPSPFSTSFSQTLQQAELEFAEATVLHAGYWEAHLALARLLATTSSLGRRLQEGYYSGGKRANRVCVCVCVCVCGGGGECDL